MLTLNIPVTSAGFDAIKAEFTRTLREVKSSHRCEAVARGSGFRTYAALLAATQSPDPVIATADGMAFRSYLADHGFDVSPLLLYRAVARIAIRAVLDKTPLLTMNGMGLGPPVHKADGKRENPREHYARIVESRKELLGDHATEEFMLSLAFLKRVPPIKTIRPDTSSYWLKHIAENYACTYPEGDQLGPQHVSNGTLIAAAIHAGFKYKTYVDRLGYDLLTVDFNMPKALLYDLDCDIRPNGARAQDRRRQRELQSAANWSG